MVSRLSMAAGLDNIAYDVTQRSWSSSISRFFPPWRNAGIGTSLFRLWQEEAKREEKALWLHVLLVIKNGVYVEMIGRSERDGNIRAIV
jgi:hypothetical protein